MAKQPMTFRLPGELASSLRTLPNQTAFVERALRDALGQVCPLCEGSGQAPEAHLTVSDMKKLALGRLDRAAAAQLKALVRLGRALLATELALEPAGAADGLAFRLARDDELLLCGSIPRGAAELRLAH